MESRFFAVLKNDKTVINKGQLSAIQAINAPILYLFRRDFDNVVNWGNGDYFQYSFIPIDLTGKVNTIELESFKIVDIGAEKRHYRNLTRKILVEEKSTGLIRDFDTQELNETFITTELLPLLNKLSKVASFEALDKLDDYDRMKQENESLKNKIEELEKLLGNH